MGCENKNGWDKGRIVYSCAMQWCYRLCFALLLCCLIACLIYACIVKDFNNSRKWWLRMEVAVLNCSLSLPFLLFVPWLHMHASRSIFLISTNRYSQLLAIDLYYFHPQSKLTKARNNQSTLPRPVNKKGYTKPPPNSLSTHSKTLPFQSVYTPPQGSREYGFIPKHRSVHSVIRRPVIFRGSG